MQTPRAGRGVRCALAGIALTCLASVVPTSSITPASAAGPEDQVFVWNGIAIAELIGVKSQPPPVAVLHLAMVHGAVYDAVNAITDTHEPLLVSPAAEATDSKDAAAATAAYRVLLHLLPDRAGPLGTAYQASLDAIPNGPAEVGGAEVGEAAAAEMIFARTGDGRFGNPAFSFGAGVGEWRPIGGANNFGWVGNVKPFVIDDAADFATRGPLDVASRSYAREFDEVKALGRATGSTRTEDQTEQARFWADHTTAQWSRVFRQLSGSHGLTIDDNARYFAMLFTTGSDAIIACFQDKERHGFWRPQTAIVEAANDGNPATTPDPAWTPLIANPPYPDQPSGANCLASAFAETLKDFLGGNSIAFDVTHASLGLTRSFTHISQAVDEVVNARVYAGLHFMTADVDGATLGREVAQYRKQHAFGAV